MWSVSEELTRSSMALTPATPGRCSRSLAVGDPDVLDLRRVAQELPPFSGAGIEPIARPENPGLLHVARRCLFDGPPRVGFGGGPDGIDVHVLGEPSDEGGGV